jgi:hypothetical protein
LSNKPLRTFVNIWPPSNLFLTIIDDLCLRRNGHAAAGRGDPHGGLDW